MDGVRNELSKLGGHGLGRVYVVVGGGGGGGRGMVRKLRKEASQARTIVQ